MKFPVQFVFLALVGLSSAQCGNTCDCANKACCQSTPYSIFNVGPGNSQQFTYRPQLYRGTGNLQNAGQVPCLNVNPIRFPLQRGEIPNIQCIVLQMVMDLLTNENLQLDSKLLYVTNGSTEVPEQLLVAVYKVYQNQPVFKRIVEDTNDNRQIDNICETFFPLPDSDNTFLTYTSTVYCDGSNTVSTGIDTTVDIGTIQRATPYSTNRNRIFAALGDNVFVGCTRIDYGDNDGSGVFVLSIGSVTPLGGSCLQQIRNIIQCNGQGRTDGLYVLPFRLPTRCVTRQICSINNPLLYPTQPLRGGLVCRGGNC